MILKKENCWVYIKLGHHVVPKYFKVTCLELNQGFYQGTSLILQNKKKCMWKVKKNTKWNRMSR